MYGFATPPLHNALLERYRYRALSTVRLGYSRHLSNKPITRQWKRTDLKRSPRIWPLNVLLMTSERRRAQSWFEPVLYSMEMVFTGQNVPPNLLFNQCVFIWYPFGVSSEKGEDFPRLILLCQFSEKQKRLVNEKVLNLRFEWLPVIQFSLKRYMTSDLQPVFPHLANG